MSTLRTPVTEFPLAAPFNFDIFKARIAQVVFTVAPTLKLLPGIAPLVESNWTSLSPTDYSLYYAEIQAHVGGVIDADSQLFENLGNVDTVSSAGASTFVDVFDVATTAKKAGLYGFSLLSSLLMPAVVNNTAVYARLLLGGGSGVLVAETTAASATQPVGFTPSGSVRLLAGQSLRIRYQIQKMGAPAAVARANTSRLSIARLAD
jgi:hypothetical protein